MQRTPGLPNYLRRCVSDEREPSQTSAGASAVFSPNAERFPTFQAVKSERDGETASWTKTGRRLKINSRRFGRERAPSLFILARVSMGAGDEIKKKKKNGEKKRKKLNRVERGRRIWLGFPWQQSAWMQINSVSSTPGGMQPFCLRFGGEG